MPNQPLHHNAHQQPVGHPLPDWTARPRPAHAVIKAAIAASTP